MIPGNIFTRVLMIRYGQGTATAFAYDRAGRQYLVTAKHAVAGFDGAQPISIFIDGGWRAIDARLIGHAQAADVTVFATDGLEINLDGPGNGDQGVFFGQDAYFLGFPHGWAGEIGGLNGGLPSPFVKRAIISCIEQGPRPFFLDGHNNPGFSGGPVIVPSPRTGELSIVGIISGYRWARGAILNQGAGGELVFQENTGIIVSEHIARANELIDANPNGARLPQR